MKEASVRPARGTTGFTLVELMVVVGIIMVMAAVALPAISNYLRTYQIRAATQQVASQLSTARMKAISKNVNIGVTLVPINSSQYQTAVEDDQTQQGRWSTVNGEGGGGGSFTALLADQNQSSQPSTLPTGINFDNPTNCGAGAATDWGVRFNKLGMMCGVVTGGTACPTPPNPPALTNYVTIAGGAATFCLWQGSTNLRRTVTVMPGGRVLAQP